MRGDRADGRGEEAGEVGFEPCISLGWGIAPGSSTGAIEGAEGSNISWNPCIWCLCESGSSGVEETSPPSISAIADRSPG